MNRQAETTRFAPSPTGRLHLGHAFAALFAWREARKSGGRFLLRLEDIDVGRCRPEFEEGILEDLSWLGIEWDAPVLRQSERFREYREALDRLEEMGLIYPCFCTRREIAAEVDRAVAAPHGPEGPLYPGTCRVLDSRERARRLEAGHRHALRLDAAAADRVAGALSWSDRDRGEIPLQPGLLGDAVLARVDAPVSYHLAVTVDDAAQGVSLVTRGEDLFASTHVHRLLLGLLDLPVPQWRHHRLLVDGQGRKFSKRDDSVTLAHLRDSGAAASDLRRELGF